MPHTPLSRYQDDLKKPDFEADPAQQLAVEKLQQLYDELLTYQAPTIGFLTKIGFKKAEPKKDAPAPVKKEAPKKPLSRLEQLRQSNK